MKIVGWSLFFIMAASPLVFLIISDPQITKESCEIRYTYCLNMKNGMHGKYSYASNGLSCEALRGICLRKVKT